MERRFGLEGARNIPIKQDPLLPKNKMSRHGRLEYDAKSRMASSGNVQKNYRRMSASQNKAADLFFLPSI